MSRIRTIKPEMATSEALADIPREVLYTWVMLWPHCDDYGHHLAEPRLVKAAIYPMREDLDSATVAAELDILATARRICRYLGCDAKAYLHILGWGEHQRIDNASKSRIPGCPVHEPDRPCPIHADCSVGSLIIPPSRALTGADEGALARFWAKVERGPECWAWTASFGRKGYGQFWHEGRLWLAHRFAYEAMQGAVPEGAVLDHLCRNRACVNPSRLEPVSSAENRRRGLLGELRPVAATRGDSRRLAARKRTVDHGPGTVLIVPNGTHSDSPRTGAEIQPSLGRTEDEVQRIFDAWVEATGRTGRTRLDAKRRNRILAALRDYPVEDLVDAVRGWRWSPHHRGENESGTVYNDLDLLLRDSRHIEQFRDWERGIGRPVPMAKAERAAQANVQSLRQGLADGTIDAESWYETHKDTFGDGKDQDEEDLG